MAPGSTLKVVKEGAVEREFRLQVPPRVYNFKDSCKSGVPCILPSQSSAGHLLQEHCLRLTPQEHAA